MNEGEAQMKRMIVAAALAAAGTAAAAPVMMSPEWANDACNAWNADPVLTQKLHESGWDANHKNRGYKILRIARTQQEVTREIDAVHVQAGAPRHLEVDHGQADGDADAPVEHFVDEAVARVVVPFAVPRKSLFVVQVLVERPHGVVADLLHARGRFLAHAIERRHVRSRIERRVLHARNRKRRRRQLVAGRVHGFLQLGGQLTRARIEVERKRHG